MRKNNYFPSKARELLGAYYTPTSAAEFMVEWVLRHSNESILEPSFGDGSFLQTILSVAHRKNISNLAISGFEIDETAIELAKNNASFAGIDINHKDFLAAKPFKVQAVIGNPPYVRLRKLISNQQEQALKVAFDVLGQKLDPSSSLWLPFILHSLQFLSQGGRLALVLPYEFTYVRYARPLWGVLQKKFGSLKVLRTHQRLFPDILQDVVILLAEDFGSQTDEVQYQAFERVSDLLAGNAIINKQLSIDGLLRGERLFIKSLLSDELNTLLQTQIEQQTVTARQIVRFNIGYVSADKEFFHPDEVTIRKFQLPSESLRPAMTSARMLKGMGLVAASSTDKLFYPNKELLTEAEKQYIKHGESNGVSNRYKCRMRKPWFVVPDVRVPDVILSVFSEKPILLLNNKEFLASNSLLCGFMRNTTKEFLAAAWYTSLTLLQFELEVHALGGGVMVMVPNEAGNLRLPKNVEVSAEHLDRIDLLLQQGNILDAYFAGDEEILIKQLKLSKYDVELIHAGIQTLSYWRTSAHSSFKKHF